MFPTALTENIPVHGKALTGVCNEDGAYWLENVAKDKTTTFL